MARIVRLAAQGPVKVETQGKPVISLCACGLSKTFPLCDGSHKTTSRLEEPGKLYHYDPATLAVIKIEDDPIDPPAPAADSSAPTPPATPISDSPAT